MSQDQSSNKRIAKNTLMLYIRMLISMLVGLYTSRVVLQTLGVEDYGVYGVVGGIVGMLGFINASMSISTSRFITFEMGKGDFFAIKNTFSTSLIIHVLIAIFVIVGSETIGLWFLNNRLVIPSDRLMAANWVFQCSIITAAISITQTPYSAVIMSNEKMDIYAYFELLNVCLKLLIVYILMIGDYDKLILYSFLSLGISLLMCLLYRVYCIRHFPESHFCWIWENKKLKEMLGFSFWNMFGELANVGMFQGLSLMMNMYFGVVVNAARSIANQVLGLVDGFVTNFNVALSPQITKSYASGDSARTIDLLMRGSRYSYFLFLVFALPAFLEAEHLLRIWLGILPEHTLSFVRITLVMSMVNTLTPPLLIGIRATGKIREYQIIVSSVAFLLFPLAYIALENGVIPETVMMLHLCIYIILQFIRIWIAHDVIQFSMVDYFRKVIFSISIVTILSLAIPTLLYIHLMPSLLNAFFIVVSCLISVMLTVMTCGMNSRERVFFRNRLLRLFISNRNNK